MSIVGWESAPLEQMVEKLLACPACYGRLLVRSGEIRCGEAACDFRGVISDGIVMVEERSSGSYFDDKHEVMRHGSEKPGVWRLCYAEQAGFLEIALRPSTVVLDVGCGPFLPYRRSRSYFLIGLDPSYESLRQNAHVDLRIFGRAQHLPLPDRSIDTVVSLYAIHHLGGQGVSEKRERLAKAFSEFGRVVRPGGDVFIFELEPWWPVWWVQFVVWSVARRILRGLDVFFWRETSLREFAARHFGRATAHERKRFPAPPLLMFAPIFAWPRMKIPRMLFPFRVHLYHWRF